MSFLYGTQWETLFAGPPAYQAAGNATTGWVAPVAVVTTAQPLYIGATGASGAAGFVQPYIPAGYFQQGRSGQLVKWTMNGIYSWVATASTTATFAFGFAAAANGATTTAPTMAPLLVTSPALINNTTAQTNQAFRIELDLLVKQVGIGTSAVSTSILATGTYQFNAATTANAQSGLFTPTMSTTTDMSVNNWCTATVTFGTNASASNTVTMLNTFLFGCN